MEHLDSNYFIMCSDDDQPAVQDLSVGFNIRAELVVRIKHTDYDNHAYDCMTGAIVNEDDARAMARRHGIPYSEVPALIGECMADWGCLVNPTFRQVRDCFSDILESLLAEDCRFRIERIPARNGYCCC